MSHAPEGMLQAYLDDEVTGAARHEIAEHLAACTACAAQLDALRSLNARGGAALAAIDRPVAVGPALRAVRARQGPVASPARRREARVGGNAVRAALLMLAFAGAASAAIPGTPVREWLTGAWDRVSTFFAGERTQPVVVEPAVLAPDESGLTIAPHQGRVTIALTDVAADATIRIQLVDQANASVVASTPGARFGTARGRIDVSEVGARDVVVRLPLDARSAVVEVNGRTVATKDGDGLVAHVATIGMRQHELVVQPRF